MQNKLNFIINFRRYWLWLLIVFTLCLTTGTQSGHLSQCEGCNGEEVDTSPPQMPVKLIFIHHSTGGDWLADPNENDLGGGLAQALMQNNYYVSATNYGWGPDSIGDLTDIPDWITWFQSEKSPVYVKALFREDDKNLGGFGDWKRLSKEPKGENQVVLFKSCFPNSDLEGNPNDPASEEGWLTVGHAKYVYNQILKYFSSRPDKLFIAITAPPLIDSQYGANARAFNLWLVNDWLKENAYELSNVAVFDYYNILTGPDNHHRVENNQIQHTFTERQNWLYYPSGDDHPSKAGNIKGTAEFVPLLNAYFNRWSRTLQPSKTTEPEPETETQSTIMETDQGTISTPIEATQSQIDSGKMFCSAVLIVPIAALIVLFGLRHRRKNG